VGSGEGVVEVELEEPQLKLARVATAGNASRTSKRRYFQSILTVILAFAMGAFASPIRFVNVGLGAAAKKAVSPWTVLAREVYRRWGSDNEVFEEGSGTCRGVA